MEDEGHHRMRIALLIAGIALTLIILDISGVARTVSKPSQGTGRSITTTSTVYVTRTVTSREAQGGTAPETQATAPTTSYTSSNATTAIHTSIRTQSTSLVTPRVNRLEGWMLFVSLDPAPSFTASGIWRINQTTIGALIIVIGNFSTHLVPYRAVLNLTITGPGIGETFTQEELPLQGRIERRTTAYELTLSHVNPPQEASYLVSIYFQREDGAVLKAQGWDRVNDQVYREVQLTLRDKPPWEG